MINGIGQNSKIIAPIRDKVLPVRKITALQNDVYSPRVNYKSSNNHDNFTQSNSTKIYNNYNPYFAAHILVEAGEFDPIIDKNLALETYKGVTNNFQSYILSA